MRLGSSYTYMKDRNEWVGIVFEQGWLGKKVLTVGVMSSEQGIKLWLSRVMSTRAWENGSEPDDKYGSASNAGK